MIKQDIQQAYKLLGYVNGKEAYGVYGYADEDGVIVYVGIDKHADTSTRDKDHKNPLKINQQFINRKVQEEKLTYVLLAATINKEFAYFLEKSAINFFKPKYNVKKTK